MPQGNARRRTPPLGPALVQILVLALLMPALSLVTAVPARAQAWAVEGQNDPSTFDCDHLYYSNYRSGMQFRNGADGGAEIQNTVVTKRVGSGLPDYWSSNMAAGTDPDSGKPALFYSDYRGGNRKVYKHVSGTNQVTDEIYAGRTRELPAGTNWGGLTYDSARDSLYGAANLTTFRLMRLDVKTGASKEWGIGDVTTEIPNDPVIRYGTTLPDMFVDKSGGVYFGMSYGGTYLYRFDPGTAKVTRITEVSGAGAIGTAAYGMAYHNGAVYLGSYDGSLYRVDPRDGTSARVGTTTAQSNQIGRIQSESGGSWPITDLASCGTAPDLTEKLVAGKTADRRDAKPGDTVTYTLTVTNEGASDATGVSLSDDLTGVVDDATYNGDARVRVGGTAPADQPSYDPATRKLTWTGTVPAGQTATLTYTVKVGEPPGGDKALTNALTVPDSNCSEGSDDADCASEVELATLRLRKSSSPAAPRAGDTVTYTVTLHNDGNAAWRGAEISDDLSGVLDDATYGGDAAARSANGATVAPPVLDAAARKLTWRGDVAAGDTVTLTYSVTVGDPPPGDKRLANTVTGPDGSNCPPDAADPAPECSTDEPLQGLRIRKSVSRTDARPGDTVTYTLTAENTGGARVTGAELTDDLSGVVDDAAYNGDAAARVGGTAAPKQPTYDSGTRKLTWKGDLEPGATVTVTYSVTVDSPPRGDKRLRNAVTGPEGSSCEPGAAEASCATNTPVGLLRVEKKADRSEAGPGDVLTYTVTVTNTGEGDYDGASFSDDLSGVLDDAAWNDDVTRTSGRTEFSAAEEKLGWRGDLAAGESVTVTYSVTVDSPPRGDKRLRNAVTGPEGSSCPPGAASPAPECGGAVPVKALTVKKTASPANPRTGDTVTYTVTVENTGGAAYDGATFRDDLSGVLDDATWDGDVRSSAGSADFDAAARTLTWRGDLAVGARATVTYTVTVTNKGDRYLRNVVTSADSNCERGSADDDCRTVLPRPDLTLSKSASPASAKPGDTVTYTVRVRNTGTAAYDGATFTDRLTGVLDDAAWNGDLRASSGDASFDGDRRAVTWRGDVAAGAAVTITYTVTVDSPPRGDKRLRNTLTSTGDTNCPPGGDDPDCSSETPLAALDVAKTASPREPGTGDRVTYTVTVENTGTAAYDGATFTDDLSGVLDDATWNGDARADRGDVSYAPPRLTWRGDLPAGAKATVTYSVTVHNQGDHRITNTVTADDSNCAGRSSGPPADPDCRRTLNTPKLELRKSASPATAVPGGKVTYTVEFRNTGTADARDASFTDDLSGVLDDATWNDDARADQGVLTRDGALLTWRGTVPAGETVTVTYSVTVDDPPGGDKTLTNGLTSPDETNCPLPMAGSRAVRAPRAPLAPVAPECGTDTPVRSLALHKTASPHGPVEKGDKVTYTVTATNTGSAALDPASFTDDLSGVLDDASWNGDTRASRGAAYRDGEVLRWSGRLAPGESAVVTYSVTVTGKGNGTLRNAVTTSTPGGNCRTADEKGCGTTTEVTDPPDKPVKPGKPGKPGKPVKPLPKTGGAADGVSDWLYPLLGGLAALLMAAGTYIVARRGGR
ncbi:isopeptide-forming domain-containing fimbrial protein [Streptomyces sp. NPDC048172]|uniref:DUF7927 domain-containing protein n=1 Tax=Streptomyces sp. NPDC048172 TaxID=3365505 RepID=UPI00371FB326